MLSRICKSVKCLEKIFSEKFLQERIAGGVYGVCGTKKRGTYGKNIALRRSCAAGRMGAVMRADSGARDGQHHFFKLK